MVCFGYPLLAGLGSALFQDMLYREQLLPHVPIVVIDTLHLFPETLEFMSKVEQHYGITTMKFKPDGMDSRQNWNDEYGSDLYMVDPVRYDQLAKVEPLERALKVMPAVRPIPRVAVCVCVCV